MLIIFACSRLNTRSQCLRKRLNLRKARVYTNLQIKKKNLVVQRLSVRWLTWRCSRTIHIRLTFMHNNKTTNCQMPCHVGTWHEPFHSTFKRDTDDNSVRSKTSNVCYFVRTTTIDSFIWIYRTGVNGELWQKTIHFVNSADKGAATEL